MIILSLDPSLKAIGWCVYDTGKNEVLHYGVYKDHAITDLDTGFYEAVIWLEFFLEQSMNIDLLAIEMPIYNRNARTFCEQCQLVGVLRVTANSKATTVMKVYPSERRKAMGIDFKGKSAKEVKQMIMDEVNQRYGLEIESDHESDAVAIALSAKEKLNDKHTG